MAAKLDLIGLILSAMFIGFFIAGLTLIDVVFTIAPFTIYGVETAPITINAGALLILISLISLLLLASKKERRTTS